MEGRSDVDASVETILDQKIEQLIGRDVADDEGGAKVLILEFKIELGGDRLDGAQSVTVKISVVELGAVLMLEAKRVDAIAIRAGDDGDAKGFERVRLELAKIGVLAAGGQLAGDVAGVALSAAVGGGEEIEHGRIIRQKERSGRGMGERMRSNC